MLWQNASARTVPTRSPEASRGQSSSSQRADRGGTLALLAERREVVPTDQQRGRRVHRVQVQRPPPREHVARGSAGRPPRGGRRSGRHSAATAHRTGRRSRPRPRPTRRTRTSAGRIPLSRRSHRAARRRGSRRRRRRRARPGHARGRRRRCARRTPPTPTRRAARSRARPAARPGRCAAAAGRPSRGRRCRRRRGRGGCARWEILLPPGPRLVVVSAPAIVLIAPEHADEMQAGFARYVAEYDVRARAVLPRGAPDHARHRRPRAARWRCSRASPCCPTPRSCTASTSSARRSRPRAA